MTDETGDMEGMEGMRDEARCWMRLGEKLAETFPEIWCSNVLCQAPAPQGARWHLGKLPSYKTMLGNPDGFEADLLRAEKPFRLEIETAIRARCSGRSEPISAEVRYWLHVRAYVVRWYVYLFEIDRKIPGSEEVTETIFPFPDARPWSGIIEWLMIAWWKDHGPAIAALLRLQEIWLGTGKTPDNE
jgi:hypothetical protein